MLAASYLLSRMAIAIDCPNGAIQAEQSDDQGRIIYCYKDGKWHGPAEAFYPSGKRQFIRNYLLGEPDGKFESWHENGVKAGETEFKGGKKTGVFKEWYPSGAKKIEAHYYRLFMDEFQAFGKCLPRESIECVELEFAGKLESIKDPLASLAKDRCEARLRVIRSPKALPEFIGALLPEKIPCPKIGEKLFGNLKPISQDEGRWTNANYEEIPITLSSCLSQAISREDALRIGRDTVKKKLGKDAKDFSTESSSVDKIKEGRIWRIVFKTRVLKKGGYVVVNVDSLNGEATLGPGE